MVEGSGELSFVQKPRLVFVVPYRFGGEQLEGHRPDELRIVGAVDDSPSASPQLGDDMIMGDRFAD
jgi:hypothetical protein